YIDTLFVCTATAFMILFTGQYNVANNTGGFIVEKLPGIAIGPEYTQYAINSHFPTFGSGFVAIALLFFAFTTIMAYYYIAETNLSFLNKDGSGKWKLLTLRAMLLIATFYGSIRTAEMAWTLGDIGVGMMAWLNMIAIILLRKPALLALRDYQAQLKAGKDPQFHPEALGIKNADYWDRQSKMAENASKVTSR